MYRNVILVTWLQSNFSAPSHPFKEYDKYHIQNNNNKIYNKINIEKYFLEINKSF